MGSRSDPTTLGPYTLSVPSPVVDLALSSKRDSGHVPGQ